MENQMNKWTLGFFLTIAGACAMGAGCSSSSSGGTGGKTGTDGGGTGGVTGTGGTVSSTGGSGAGGHLDAGADVPADAGDAGSAATFTAVFAILSDKTTPSPDTSPGCTNCHDGVIPDGGAVVLPHVLNFADKAIAYQMLVGVDSIRCPAADGGVAVKRVAAGMADASVLVQKLSQGRGMGTACDRVPMPLNRLVPADGGGADAAPGPDAGFVQLTHFAISAGQLATIVDWVNAGAPNN
jgi:hypothetical protein